MIATWKYTVRRLRLPTVGWALAMLAMAVLVVFAFDYMVQKNKQLLVDLIAAMPPMLQAMVGDAKQFATPRGFLDAKFFSQSGLFIGIYAVLVGSGLLVADEEKGRLDLLAAYPISRQQLYWGRVLGMLTSIAVIAGTAWLGLAVSLPFTSIEIAPLPLLISCLTLFAVALCFAGLAVLLSLLLPSRVIAAGTAGCLLMASHLIGMFAPGVPFLQPIHNVLPFRFYQGGRALAHFDGIAFAMLVVLTAAALVATAWLFEKRDIRVMGEAVLRAKKLLRNLAILVAAYALLVTPVAIWHPYQPPVASPADILKSDQPIPTLPLPMPGAMQIGDS